jgi:hypothetical protein
MNTNKMFLLRNGRIVSVTRASTTPMEVLTPSGLDVSVKEPREEFFHAPIGLAHPKYWKLKTLDPSRQRILQLKYSGLNKREIDIALADL